MGLYSTKYDIGQDVWVLDKKGFLTGGKARGIYPEVVRSITITESGTVVYNDGYGKGYFYEDWAFTTKEDAFEHT